MKKALSMILAIMMLLSTLSCLSVVSFAAEDPAYEAEVEANDTSANAQEIEAEKIYRGNSNDAGDVDWYKFKNTHDYFELTFKFDVNSDMTGVKDGWTIYLYRPEDLNSAFISETVTTASWTSAKYPYTGEIYVKVQPDAFDNGYYAPKANSYYNIGVTTTQNVLWENEDNDEKIDATTLNVGDTYIGASQTRDDIDWYKFNNENDYFELSFNFDANSNLDGVADGWTIYLYRPENLNSAFISETVTTASWTSAKYPYTGEIYVKVQPDAFDNGYYAPKANSYYNISVTTTQNVLWENEINDSTKEANVIKNGTKYIGASQTYGDVDWYKLENRNGYVDIVLDIDYDKCSAEQVGDGWSVFVYSDNDFTTPIFKKTEIKAKTNLTKIAIGNYAYIKVQPDALNNNYYAPEANCYYDLTVTHTPATPKVATTNEIGGVNVTWNKVDSATKYVVFRRQGGSNTWVNIGTTTGNTLFDKNVKSGVYYVYSVRAYNSLGKYSDFVTANTQTRKYMATPKLTTIYNHQNGLAIKWNAVAGVTNGYRVYRRGAGSTYWTYLGTTKNLYFIDSQVKNKSGEYFRYTVIADGDYHSKFDTTGLYLKRLANPTLTSAVSSKSGITVKWGAVKGTTGYYVYRKTANSTWTRVGTVGGTNNTTFLDKTAKKGTTYTYTVKAVYGATTSAYNTGISCYDKY